MNARACGAPTQHLTNLEEKPVLETAGQRQAKVQRELDVREDPPLLRSGHGQQQRSGDHGTPGPLPTNHGAREQPVVTQAVVSLRVGAGAGPGLRPSPMRRCGFIACRRDRQREPGWVCPSATRARHQASRIQHRPTQQGQARDAACLADLGMTSGRGGQGGKPASVRDGHLQGELGASHELGKAR